MASLENEYLFWVPPAKTEHGVMPGFYERATTETDRQALIAMGGVDISSDPQSWVHFNRAFQEAALASA